MWLNHLGLSCKWRRKMTKNVATVSDRATWLHYCTLTFTHRRKARRKSITLDNFMSRSVDVSSTFTRYYTVNVYSMKALIKLPRAANHGTILACSLYQKYAARTWRSRIIQWQVQYWVLHPRWATLVPERGNVTEWQVLDCHVPIKSNIWLTH